MNSHRHSLSLLVGSSSKQSLIVFLAFLLGLVATPALLAQTKLSYKFKADSKQTYLQETEQKQSMNVAGMNIETTVSQATELSQLVTGVDGGTASLRQTVARFRTKMEMPGNNIEYDSKDGKKPDGPVGALVGPLFEAMVGSEFNFKMAADGKVSDVKFSDKLANALKGNPILAQMGGMFSEEGMKSMMQQSSIPLPTEAVMKGQSWNGKVETKTPIGTMTITTTYTYQGQETRNNVALEKISTKSEMKIEGAGENKDVEVKLKDADIQGTIYFDNQAGNIVESSQVQKMTMEIKVMGQALESKQTQTIKYKLVP